MIDWSNYSIPVELKESPQSMLSIPVRSYSKASLANYPFWLDSYSDFLFQLWANPKTESGVLSFLCIL